MFFSSFRTGSVVSMFTNKTVEEVNFYGSVFSPIVQLTRALEIGFIVILSSKQLNSLGISLDMVAASIELISNLFAPIESLGMKLQDIQQAVTGINRVNGFYNVPEDQNKSSELKSDDIIPDCENIINETMADQISLQNDSIKKEQIKDFLIFFGTNQLCNNLRKWNC